MHHQRVNVGYKPALWYFKPDENHTRPTMYSNIDDVIKSKLPDKSLDPWAQSTVEAEHVIRPLTVEKEIVLDPMMGTGTFGVPVLQLDRKFFGIEINKQRFEIAQGKLSNFNFDI
jgi:DNA modification methylase